MRFPFALRQLTDGGGGRFLAIRERGIGDVGDAHGLDLLVLRHARFVSSFALRELSRCAPTMLDVLVSSLRIKLLEQLPAPADGARPDAYRHLLKLVEKEAAEDQRPTAGRWSKRAERESFPFG